MVGIRLFPFGARPVLTAFAVSFRELLKNDGRVFFFKHFESADLHPAHRFFSDD